MILPATTAEEARTVGERIMTALAENAYQAPGRGPVPVTASIGTAAFPEQGRTVRELIAVADRALYRVKGDGGAAVDGGAAADSGAHRRPTATRRAGGKTQRDDAARLADAV